MLSDTDLCTLLRAHGASQTVVEILRQHGYDAQLCAGHVTAVYGGQLKNIASNFFADASKLYLQELSSDCEKM